MPLDLIQEAFDQISLPVHPSAEHEAGFSIVLRRDVGPGSPFVATDLY
jgi:hypothetical protein